MMIGRDGKAGLFVVACCAALWVLTSGIQSNPLVPVSPAFYPRLVIGFTAVIAALLVGADLRVHRMSPRGARAPTRANRALVVATFAAFSAYVVLLPLLGFRVATWVYLIAASALLAPPRGARAWWKVVVLAAATTLVTYLVFEHYLTVLLPRGTWTGY